MGILRAFALAILITVTPPSEGTRWHKRFLFLVDVSGSMSGVKTSQAVKAFLEIARQSTDDMEMNVYAFDDQVHQWSLVAVPLVGEDDLVYGVTLTHWRKLPDQKAIDDAVEFLHQSNRYSGTQIIPALEKVLHEKGQFNLVIIGDGQYLQETSAALVLALKPFRMRKIVVSIVSIGDPTDQSRAMVKAMGGGLFKIAPSGQ